MTVSLLLYTVLPLLFAVIGASLWINREALLRQAAAYWIVSDDIRPADAVVVLGGGLHTRPFAAAEDYRNGLAQKVLVANVNLNNVEAAGPLPSHTAMNRAVLIKLGVPETAIETFGHELANTYEEGNALREWAAHSHATSVIVPTEIFSSRRVRWVLTRALAGTGTDIQIQTLDALRNDLNITGKQIGPNPKFYSQADWWKTRAGFRAFKREVLKYAYYRFKYWRY
jgi:uncharacterized SAM-binding protein YcdF (DUF218 family)